jgi:hypothetical protein
VRAPGTEWKLRPRKKKGHQPKKKGSAPVKCFGPAYSLSYRSHTLAFPDIWDSP